MANVIIRYSARDIGDVKIIAIVRLIVGDSSEFLNPNKYLSNRTKLIKKLTIIA